MNQHLTRVNTQQDYILLDGSGSMAGAKWLDSVSAINTYIDVLKGENINSNIYYHIFSQGWSGDNQLDLCAFDDNIGKWEAMQPSCPSGGTPLYDAIALMARRIKHWECPPGRITILTDGEESDSRHTDIHQAKSFLDWLRALGWQIVFIGADFNNSEQARLLGADDSNSVGVAQARLVDAARAHGKKAAHHARTGDDMAYSDEEKTKFGGYLGGPSK